jgi:hypothetical protein
MRTIEEIIARLHYVQDVSRLQISHHRLAKTAAARSVAEDEVRDLQRRCQVLGLADLYQDICSEHREMWRHNTFHKETRPLLATYYETCKLALQNFQASEASKG